MFTEIKALFLDRDGVINVDYGYVSKKEDFIFRHDIFAFCRAAQDLGYHIFVVTNQSGIARGYYTGEDFQDLTQWMKDRFEENGVYLRHVYYCPYHECTLQGDPEKDQKLYFRKPNPGMLLQARDEHSIHMAASVMVGDKEKDMQAAHAAGVGYKILLSEKRETEETVADVVVSDLSPELFSAIKVPSFD